MCVCVFPDATVGMLLIQVTSDRIQPRIPLVKASGVDSEVFTLQVCFSKKLKNKMFDQNEYTLLFHFFVVVFAN